VLRKLSGFWRLFERANNHVFQWLQYHVISFIDGTRRTRTLGRYLSNLRCTSYHRVWFRLNHESKCGLVSSIRREDNDNLTSLYKSIGFSQTPPQTIDMPIRMWSIHLRCTITG
jgi:hypothetical protein